LGGSASGAAAARCDDAAVAVVVHAAHGRRRSRVPAHEHWKESVSPPDDIWNIKQIVFTKASLL
jgi:hypothetical protein